MSLLRGQAARFGFWDILALALIAFLLFPLMSRLVVSVVETFKCMKW